MMTLSSYRVVVKFTSKTQPGFKCCLCPYKLCELEQVASSSKLSFVTYKKGAMIILYGIIGGDIVAIFINIHKSLG